MGTTAAMMCREIGLGLGSNLGDRPGLMRDARDRLRALPGVERIESSGLYETEPMGVRPEHAHLKYLNAVVVLSGDMDLLAVARGCHATEDALGRVRSDDRFAPRTMDVDVLYADGLRVDTKRLQVPHPRWWTRRFVVRPLADVRPDLVLPDRDLSVAGILARMAGGPEVALLTRDW